MKKIISFLFVGLAIAACQTDIISHLDDKTLENGGYMRTVTPYPAGNSTFSVSKANLSGTKLELVAEAVTPDAGAQFAAYDLSIAFVDATPSNGTKSVAAVALKSLTPTNFTKDATTGYPRTTLTITGTEALSAVKLANTDITASDYFTVTGVMRLTNGKTYSAANTGANITGGAFYSSPFTYRINVAN